MKRAILITLLAVHPALPALAADLEFSAGGEAEYDDNVFRSQSNKEDDVLFRLRPGLRIYEDHGDDLNFTAGYEAPVEFSVENSSEFDEVDHIGDGRFAYHVNDRLGFFGSEHYGYIRSTLRQPDVNTQALEPTSLQVSDQRDRVKSNEASLGMNYSFSPRTVGRVIASSSFFDSTRQDRARVWSVSGSADANYRLTLKHQLGAGLGYSFQDFGDRLDIPGSQTNTYRVFGSWRWTITPTTSFDLSAGPAYLKTNQDDADRARIAPAVPAFRLTSGDFLVSDFTHCGVVNGTPVASRCGFDLIVDSATASAAGIGSTVQMVNSDPAGESDSEVTTFVDAVLSQRWSQTLGTALHYTRQQGNASGLGGTVIEDIVSLSNTWDFAERWQLAIRGDFVRRESAFDIAQTFDEVTGVAIAPGGDLIATRDLGGGVGRSFNTTQRVEVDTNSWGVGGRITHQLFKSTSIYVQARYGEQDSKSNSLGSDSDFENFLATFGVRHVFEPIPLW